MFSKFFIERPRFAVVIAIVMALAGLVSVFTMPIGMYPEIAHGAGLAALWCSWARYVYKANISRWLKYAANVWNLDIDYEHPEKTIETAINMQEQYYQSIGMPTNLKMLGVKKEDLEKLTLKCTRNRIVDHIIFSI